MSRKVLATPRMELMHVYESKVENVVSGAEKMKDDPEDSAYSTHECESKE